MNVPGDATVYCDQVPPAPKDVWASDCKEEVPVSATDVVIPGPDATSYTIQRTFSAVDACGNMATSTQTITVIECKQQCDTPIIIDCGPPTITVECGSSIAPEDIGLPIIRKNPDCPLVNYFNYVDETSGSCPITVTRHWTFRDESGNEETCTQTIHIEDTQAPVMSCLPSEITVNCRSIPEPEKCTATDNCTGDVPVEMEEVASKGDCSIGYTITRTYTATDDCGNAATTVQLIHVAGNDEDQTKGVHSGQPHNAPIGQVQVAPNPFRHESTIRFTCNASGHATVVIMDMLGHEVATLMDSEVGKAVDVAVEFKPQSESGGLFFYRISLNGTIATGKLMYRP